MADITRRPVLWKLILIGLATGVFGGLFGLGGGVIMVPAMVLLLGYDQRRAAASTPIAMLPSSLVGLISYSLQGGVDWLSGIALALGVFVGANVGLKLLHKLSIRFLEILYLVFLIVAIVSLWLKVPESTGAIHMNPLVFMCLLAFGVIPGCAMALLGIGGGIVVIPVLEAVYGVAPFTAKGTSLVMVLTGAITSSRKNIKKKTADVRTGLLMGLFAAVSIPFSSTLSHVLEPFVANALFSCFLAFVAFQYIVKIRKNK